MTLAPPEHYNCLDNSLLVAALTKEDSRSVHTNLRSNLPPHSLCDNLGLVSSLYIYTNTPPHGYGSQGPKVAESVLRAYSYNKKLTNKSLSIGGFNVERLHWEMRDGPFPYDTIHGNFSLADARLMIYSLLEKHHAQIDHCVDVIMNRVLTANSDLLTKGRQTLDPFTDSSVTASVAYQRVSDFYKENLGVTTSTLLEWIRCYFKCMSLGSVSHIGTTNKILTKSKFSKILRQRVTLTREIKTIKKSTSQNSRKKMLEWSRSFASYIKHKERGKKSRRAIASASMFLRPFLYIIEEFHLLLSKDLTGSTISIGGEEKKAKIIGVLNTSSMTTPHCSCQGTEDASKWNECLSPSLFALMHKTLFSRKVRQLLEIPPPTEMGKLFSKIAVAGNFIMSLKKVQMGPGPLATSENIYNRLDWETSEMSRFNQKTQQWLRDARPLIKSGYMDASPGMLMGMLNAASTTLGLLAENYMCNPARHKVTTLRSSDDSTTVYASVENSEIVDVILLNKASLELLGINLIVEKTFIFRKGYAKYTSWFQDEKFLSQFGVETSSLRPQGKNPADDFFSIAKGTATALSTLTMNHLGATIRLLVGINNVRRLWRIVLEPSKRPELNLGVALISDGGKNLWNVGNCHLEETSMRWRLVKNEEDTNYLYRVCNPTNPFASEPTEDISYSKDKGRIIVSEVETPRTVYHYVKKSNSTVTNSLKNQSFEREKQHAEVSKIVKTLVPTALIKYPSNRSPMSLYLEGSLKVYGSCYVQNEEDKKMLSDAIDLLRKGRENGNIPDDFSDSDGALSD